MHNLNITVANDVATYCARDGFIVCGNNDYQITFTFDAKWEEYFLRKKIARFKWNDGFKDVEFYGNVVLVPHIENAYSVEVGIYVDDICTTTPAVIPCARSILCGSSGDEYIPPDKARNIESRVTANKTAILDINQNFTYSASNNLFNPDTAVRGEVDTNAVFTESDTGSWRYSTFIKTDPNTTLVVTGVMNGKRQFVLARIYEFASDRSFIKMKTAAPTSGGNNKSTLSDTTEYIRVAVSVNITDICVKRYIEDANLIYEPYFAGERLMPKGFVASRNAGLSAYELAKQSGFEGTQEEWFESLRGEQGIQGLSAWEVAVEHGFAGSSLEWLESLKGKDGVVNWVASEHHITIEKPYDDGGAWFKARLLLYGPDYGVPIDNIAFIYDLLKYARIECFYEYDSPDGERIPSVMYADESGTIVIEYYKISGEGSLTRHIMDFLPLDIKVTDDIVPMRYYDGM